ncbi:MAG: hypothetical protein A2Z16_14215 [Chloroflexi bacterium RBG_16_54_18]|nr:MAG: hypothetical protein A2Z16_14215 [Chloroflexi bacterium RBG_16_54_18]
MRSQVSKGAVFLVVGLVFIGWLINTPSGLLGKADAVGYAVCHRIDVRSFHLGERPLPLCARCSGMYLAAILSIVYQARAGSRRSGMPGRSAMAVFGLFVFAFGLDGINSYLSLFPGAPTLYQPQNWLRLLTGTGMGLAMAGVLIPVFNQTAWRQPVPRAVFPRAASLLPLLALAGVMNILVLTENPLLLYPLALISAVGVLLLLALVYSMVWMLLLKKENLHSTLAQMIMFLVAGFGTAVLQIALMDAARLLLTGTWDGFHLG